MVTETSSGSKRYQARHIVWDKESERHVFSHDHPNNDYFSDGWGTVADFNEWLATEKSTNESFEDFAIIDTYSGLVELFFNGEPEPSFDFLVSVESQFSKHTP